MTCAPPFSPSPHLASCKERSLLLPASLLAPLPPTTTHPLTPPALSTQLLTHAPYSCTHPPAHPPNPPTHPRNPPTCFRRGTYPRTSSRPSSAASTWHARAAGAGQQQRHLLLRQAWCSRGIPHGEFLSRTQGTLLPQLLRDHASALLASCWFGCHSPRHPAVRTAHNTAVWQHHGPQKRWICCQRQTEASACTQPPPSRLRLRLSVLTPRVTV